MVGQDANSPQAQVNQNLRAYAAFALHQSLASKVVLHFLARMETNARQFGGIRLARRINLESAPGVMQIDEHAAVFSGDRFERALDNRMAIAGRGTENVAGKAV